MEDCAWIMEMHENFCSSSYICEPYFLQCNGPLCKEKIPGGPHIFPEQTHWAQAREIESKAEKAQFTLTPASQLSYHKHSNKKKKRLLSSNPLIFFHCIGG